MSYVLSFIYFGIYWNNHHENHFAPIPTATYGLILLMAAVAYWILQRTIIRSQGAESILARTVGGDIKGSVSPLLYVVAIPAAFVRPWISGALYIAVALMWLLPDQRIERVVAAGKAPTD